MNLKFLICFMCFGTVIAWQLGSDSSEIPILSISSSNPHDFGLQIGNSMCETIQKFCSLSSTLQKSLLPYYETAEGRSIYEKYFAFHVVNFPDHMDELKGLAEGAKIPVEYAALLMFSNELLLLMPSELAALSAIVPRGNSKVGAGCSDVLLNRGNEVFLSHNEDAEPQVSSLGFLLHAYLNYSTFSEPLEFWAYTYPAQLPGNAFSWTSKGVAFSINDVFPINVAIPGPSQCFVCRELLNSESDENAVQLMKEKWSASGVSVNIGGRRNDGTEYVSNIETSSSSSNLMHVPNGNDSFHANLYLRMSEKQHDDASSMHRLARFDELAPLHTVADILGVLGDTKDDQYPIYRNAKAPDTSSTAATVLFELSSKLVNVYHGNPKTTSPVFKGRLF